MFAYFFKPSWFLPDAHFDDVYRIDYQKLYASGIRFLLIDLDNTLIPYDIDVPDQKLLDLFETIFKLGFEVVIVSNNRYSRIAPFATLVDLPFISSAKKPLKWGFNKALKQFQRKPEKSQVLVIGDQLMTDIYGAKRMGYKAFLIHPIKKRSEKWYTKINRFLEQTMFKRLKKKYPAQYQALNLEKR